MKKVLFVIMVLLIVLPINVKANIVCNDGTRSPSCKDCHRGCCSHHGGCSANSYNSNNSSKKYTTAQAPKTTRITTSSYNGNTISKESYYYEKEEDDSDDPSILGPLTLIGGIGGIGYCIGKKKGK